MSTGPGADAEPAAHASRRGLFQLGLGLALGGGAGMLAGGRAARTGSSARLRPPGALEEPEFLAACLRCGQCVAACPVHCLRFASELGIAAGTPFLEPRRVPCDLCAERASLRCIDVCPSGALAEVVDRRAIRMGSAHLDEDTCLAYQGVVCRACWHACPLPDEAIRFDARLRPVVDVEHCLGCGLCEHACPNESSSIAVDPRRGGEPG